MTHLVTTDEDLVRAAFGRFPSGVAALCATIDGEPEGIVASSFSVGVSLDPPLVLFSVRKASTTWPTLRGAARIGVSILGESHEAACRQIASRGDRFSGLDIHTSEAGAVFIEQSPVWLECSILSETPAGDHDIVVLQVETLRIDEAAEPLVYHGSAFRQLAGAL